ncbi:PAS domain-containing sensor histidine kinase [Streptomyces sp. LHD-70]|uniref:PAS domain-containing sensor histidine kinase n=1 Tax=Streptomyces sp. LHD-70 TaxID=3072140 RepID=UPI0028108BDE|nr:PAS domain-containing sensor histidine kinase [Streptomyces sp. LHD-70]MDQ8701111.1 PAS domain-containing sensor histidine kinase [Streptomyces sp. LHD-70]
MELLEDGDAADIVQLFSGIVDQSGAGIYLIQDGVMQYVNRSFATFFGTTPDRLMGRGLADVAPPQQRETLVAQYEKRIAAEGPDDHFVVRTNLRSLGRRTIELHGTRVDYRQRPAVVGIGIDVTAREEAHAELVESRAQLRQLMSVVEAIQDKERGRIALELHDVIGGMLTALKFDLARLRMRIENTRDREMAGDEATCLLRLTGEITDLAQETIEAVRRLSDELRPSMLDHLGFHASIQDLAARFTARFRVDTTVDLPDERSELGPEAELEMLRIVQEALTNVARHAEASHVRVTLSQDQGTVRLEVADDGRGLPEAGTATTGLGLVGIRERARRVGGTVSIGNGPTGGVVIQVTAAVR